MTFRTFSQSVARGFFLANGKLIEANERGETFEMTYTEAQKIATSVLLEEQEAVSTTLVRPLAETIYQEWDRLPGVDF